MIRTIVRRGEKRRPEGQAVFSCPHLHLLSHPSVGGSNDEGVSCQNSEPSPDPQPGKLMDICQVYIVLCMQLKPWESVEDIVRIGYDDY